MPILYLTIEELTELRDGDIHRIEACVEDARKGHLSENGEEQEYDAYLGETLYGIRLTAEEAEELARGDSHRIEACADDARTLLQRVA